MKWISIKDQKSIINETVLITDGYDVFPGFLDSMLEWRLLNQDLCEEIDFHVTHFMYLPDPPK